MSSKAARSRNATSKSASPIFLRRGPGGLKAGEIVSLELPKDEREKMTQQLAGLHAGTAPRPGPKARLPGHRRHQHQQDRRRRLGSRQFIQEHRAARRAPVAAAVPANGANAK